VNRESLEKFRSLSVAEFFARYREVAGFSNPARALYQIVRELVENSLDATDGHGILPEVRIYIGRVGGERDWCRVTVEDNGVGVPPNVMAEAFGKVLFGSKYVLRQTRGMYGLGVKACVLYGQASTGSPVEVQSSTRNSDYIYSMKLYIDVRKNEPVVVEEARFKKNTQWHGTRVSLTIECDWQRAKAKILEYVRRTAVIAPYADITLHTPDGETLFYPRTTGKMPKPPRKAKPHPHGVDVETLKQMLRVTKAKTLLEFLKSEFQSVGEQSALKFLEMVGLKPEMKPRRLLRGGNEELLVSMVEAMKSFKFRAPRSDYLSPLGEELIKIGLRRMFNPEWVEAVTRPPRAYQGHPFIVEVGMAYGGSIQALEEPLLLRYANKIPLLYEEKEDVSYKVVSEVNWKHYNIETPAPLVILVHVVSTKIPYKGVGKESLSDVPELESEIRNGVLELARRLKHFISTKEREAETLKKILTISKYIPEIARSLKTLSKPPEQWKPLEPGEEKDIVEALIKLLTKNITLPKPSNDKNVEDIVKKVMSETEINK